MEALKMYQERQEREAKAYVRRVIVKATLNIALNLIAIGLAWAWYDWKLALILFFAMWAAASNAKDAVEEGDDVT